MKKLRFIAILIALLLLAGCTQLQLRNINTDVPVEIPAEITEEISGDVGVYYLGQPLSVNKMSYFNGRLYMDRAQLEEALGKESNGKACVVEEKDGAISLVDIANQYDLSVVISQAESRIDFYNAQPVEAAAAEGKTTGYIRLEDVMANGLDAEGNVIPDATYNEANLEKLRFMGRNLYSRGQSYYIAWIPLFVDPVAGVTNDITSNPCLYNADFIFTLDYLRLHGARMVLHGYSHQQFDTISAVGNEFGEDTEFTVEQMNERMNNAIVLAKMLGYEFDCFEFPHYAATDASRALAEAKFDIIYQSGLEYSQQIEVVKQGDREIAYIPTPVDYVYSRYDTELWNRMDTVHQNGKLMSLFYHPTLDYPVIEIVTENDVRVMRPTDTVMLDDIVNYIDNLGYCFGHYNG